MKHELLIQYGAIKETISVNVDTIGKLMNQAKNLKSLVEKMTVQGNETIKADLEQQIKGIESTINDLVVQTDRLFDKYNEFVESIFSK